MQRCADVLYYIFRLIDLAQQAGQAGAGKAGQAATEQVRSRLASQPAFTRCVPAGNTLRRVNTLCISAHRAAERYVYPLLFSEGRDDL